MPHLSFSMFCAAGRLIHWGPFLALFIIIYVSLVSINAMLQLWPPAESLGGLLHLCVYLLQFYLVMSNYLTACFMGPGFVPIHWKPDNPSHTAYLQYCSFCEGYKPPRSHHCRKCDRCVMKMDHHCPWINTCCGHRNHGFFVNFLFFAPIGCIHSSCILGVTLYRAIFISYFAMLDDGRPVIFLTISGMLLTFFAIGLAIGVVVSVGGLWILQMRSIMRNETGIESWIREKAEFRERSPDEPESFVFPYDLGRWRNLRQVLTWSGVTVGNGINWPVREGCGEYDLTIEQMKQKQEKACIAMVYVIQRPYSGAFFPFSFGFRVICRIPCSDEHRLKVAKGDRVRVTRWRRHWLYGQLLGNDGFVVVNEQGQKLRRRGWFPRICAMEPLQPPSAAEINGMEASPDGDSKKRD